MPTGEEQAWGILSELDPKDVCSRAGVIFDDSSCLYTLESFSQDLFVSTKDKKMFGITSTSNFLLDELSRYSSFSILWYLISARDICPSGKLVKPADMPGGLIYLRGSHMLPLNRIAEKYGRDIIGFLKRGKELGGEQLSYGDASIRLLPFPRVPVTILLWGGDDEFPARADLLFDDTCRFQLPADVIWSTAMMSVLIMMQGDSIWNDPFV